MSTINPASNPLPPVDPSLVVQVHGQGGGKQKGDVHSPSTQSQAVQDPTVVLRPNEEIFEFRQILPEKTEAEKHREEKDEDEEQKKEKRSSRSKWRRARQQDRKV